MSTSTHTMCSEQGLSGEEGGLQHVCRLHDQHVLQPAQVLKLQSLVRLKCFGRHREIKEEGGEMIERARERERERESEIRRNVKTEREGGES